MRAPEGTVTSFDPPGATQGTIPMAINPAGAITGDNSQVGAFLRYPDGTFILFGIPDALATNAYAIDPAGAITGSFVTASFNRHGFLRARDGTITTFDPPGSTFTFPEATSAGGVVIGSFSDASGVFHGFLFFPEH